MALEPDHLVDIEKIKQLKARYFRSIDRKLFDELETIFSEDAIFDLEGIVERDPATGSVTTPGLDAFFPDPARAVISGRKNISHFIQTMLTPVISIHHGFTPEIEILSPNEARGTWPMEDMFFDPLPPHRKMRHGHGHYHETYTRQDGIWLIKSSTLDFAHEEQFLSD